MEWGSVTGSVERVVIVASGPSLRGITAKEISKTGAYVIAVNEAVEHVSANAFFSCDPRFKVRVLLQRKRSGCVYYVAVPDDYGTPYARVSAHRARPLRGIVYLRRITGYGPLSSRLSLSENVQEIHTGNSAYGALGVAYLLRPKRIALLGVDGDCSKGYAWGFGRPNDLGHLPALFESSCAQLDSGGISVLNGSPESTVTCFERATPRAALDWIRG